MNRQHLFMASVAILAVLCITSRAHSDVGGPHKDLEIRVQFQNLDAYPEWDFYLKYGLGNGDPGASPRLTKVEPGSSILLEGRGSRVTNVYLFAVPRGQVVEAPPKWPFKDNWVDKVPEGALPMARLSGPHDFMNPYEFHYQVEIQGRELKATCLNPRVESVASRASQPPWQSLGIGISLSAITIATGLVIWRMSARGSRRTQHNS